MPDIIRQFQLPATFMANLTSAVQFGFIAGTFIFSIFTIADRFRPTTVFFVCSIIAALCNAGILLNSAGANGLLLFRFLTGFFLAGIYPVGMKIASDHYEQGLGKSLGFLVGALVLGTALPHLLKTATIVLPWRYLVVTTSALSVTGGFVLWIFVPDGPYRRTGQRLNLSVFKTIFKDQRLRAAALGYFGHMWELYAFWAFLPVILKTYQSYHLPAQLDIPLLSFLVIGVGSVACVAAGYLSQRFGAKKIASAALLISGCCCLLSPFFLVTPSVFLFLLFLFIWGLAVVADSPLFSTLVAANAPPVLRGSALTVVTCIGFAITIASIQLINALMTDANAKYIYQLLAIGPAAGLIALSLQKEKSR
jgi:MFS family permease